MTTHWIRAVLLILALALPSWLSAPVAMATVNEVTAVDRSAGNGSVTVFPYTFRILAKTDIEVLVDTTVKTVDTDYSVDGLGNSGGGNVTFFVAPLSGTVVTRLRAQPGSQLSVYAPNEAIPAKRLEKDYDKLVMQSQQTRETLTHTLRGEKRETLDLQLPSVTARKNKALGFDTNGLPTPIDLPNSAGGDVSLATVQATGSTTARSLATRFAAQIDVRDEGAVGNGSTNDRQAFVDTDADTTGPMTCSEGTYSIGSNLTITSPIIFMGCILKPASGVVITLNGGIIASIQKIFDTSAGGTIAVGAIPQDLFPEWWGALGDGTTNDAAATQSAVTAAAPTGKPVVFQAGKTYLLASTLFATSKTYLRGVGGGTNAVLKASASLPQTDNLLDVTVSSGGLGVYAQSDITLERLTFDGNKANRSLTTFVALVRMFSVDRLKIVDCTFKDHEYILTSIGGSRNVSLERDKWTGWGKPAATAEGGPALWIANNSVDATVPTYIRAHDLDFRDGNWVGFYNFSQHSHFSLFTIANTKEGGFFANNDAPNVASDQIYTNFSINNVVKQYISASGIEMGASHNILSAFKISNTQASGLNINSNSKDVVVSNFVIYDTVKNQTDFSARGQIHLAHSGTELTSNINIHDGRIGDDLIAPIALYAVSLNTVGSVPFKNLIVRGINPSNGYVTSFFRNESQIDAAETASMIMNNLGVADVRNPNSGTWTPTLTGVANVTGTTAYACFWSRVGNIVSISGRLDVDPTAAAPTDTKVGISLPLAADFTTATQLAGTAVIFNGTRSDAGVLTPDTTNDRAELRFQAQLVTGEPWYFTGFYRIP